MFSSVQMRKVCTVGSPNIGDQVWLITSKHTEPLLLHRAEVLARHKRTTQSPSSQFVNVWVEDLVHESNARALVWVLLRQFDVNLPYTTCERCYLGKRVGSADSKPTTARLIYFLPDRKTERRTHSGCH